MNPLAILRVSPTVFAALGTALVFALVTGAVWTLRRDARVQAVTQCTSEKEVASLKARLEQQGARLLAFQADKAIAESIANKQREQLAASEASIQTRETELATLRKQIGAKPGEDAEVYGADDSWVRSRVRPPGAAASAARGSR